MKLVLISFLLLGLLSLNIYAHEMTPTYPKWKMSIMDGVIKTKMEMFNKRKDVEYYEIGVFDKDFNPIPFVSSYKVVKLNYLQHLTFEIFINKDDKKRATYVCSKSKLRKDEKVRTAISSRICSKFK